MCIVPEIPPTTSLLNRGSTILPYVRVRVHASNCASFTLNPYVSAPSCVTRVRDSESRQLAVLGWAGHRYVLWVHGNAMPATTTEMVTADGRATIPPFFSSSSPLPSSCHSARASALARFVVRPPALRLPLPPSTSCLPSPPSALSALSALPPSLRFLPSTQRLNQVQRLTGLDFGSTATASATPIAR